MVTFPTSASGQMPPASSPVLSPVPIKPSPIPPHKAISVKSQQHLICLNTFVAIILMFRFVLALVGVREESPFVSFVYSMSIPFMIPFSRMFGTPSAAQRYRLEFEVLVVLLVYTIVFFGVAKLVSIIFD